MGTIPKCFSMHWTNYSMSTCRSRTPRGWMTSSCWPTRYYVSPPTAALTNVMGLKRPACLMPWPCLMWRTFVTSSASHGRCMMAYCWWACDPSFRAIALGAVLAGLQRHIYRGHNDAAHCPPQMLSSWDHEECVEALRHVGSLSSVQSR